MPEPTRPPIEKLYAWMIEDADGEAIVGVHLASSGQWLQLVGTDRAAIEAHRSSAEKVARARGSACKVRLRMFTGGVVIDAI